MFVLGNFINAVVYIIDIIITIVYWLIIIRALITWVNPDPFNPIVQFLQRSTEPILSPIRRSLRMQFWAVDISPLIAILALIFLQRFLIPTLNRLAMILQ